MGSILDVLQISETHCLDFKFVNDLYEFQVR